MANTLGVVTVRRAGRTGGGTAAWPSRLQRTMAVQLVVTWIRRGLASSAFGTVIVSRPSR